ncbi:LysR family transcriptional regulator [Roseomonas populi]|uniref:LysR family transcriptional regulator n=1 Tax=Roseomonas populi TaxID=3121582 RepID=A0ABT1X8V1_9PROT|nr:LysR family transcriptional regulator [Roseomonas pecuniae]MCR0984531.1 LysR family transcriptional regulator [Roseomonas pecuniae]
MRLTLEQLRVFVAVAERQHVTRAAEALHLTQSATSAAIAALESRNGLRLFDRIGRGIALTAAGREFLPEARAVLARAEAAETALADLAGLGRGTLPVHASQTIASYWLPRHLVAFRRAHPGIAVPLAVGNTAQVAAAIRAGTAELGFVEGAVDDPLLLARTVATDQLVIVVAPTHPWARHPPAGLPELAESEWVLREAGSGTRSAFEEALRAAGLDPRALRVALDLPSNESVRGAVEAGLGATALSASVAAPSIEAGLLHRVALDLPAPALQRAFQVLHHRDRPPSRAAEALLALLPGK